MSHPASEPDVEIADSPVSLHTADGLCLDGDLRVPGSPRAAMVICHPHPLYGGNRSATVVDALYRRLPSEGVAVLRFDFRGVGRSEGRHDGGVGEQRDVLAALDTLTATQPAVPTLLGGWSFGADVALAVDDARHAGWFAVAPPLSIVDPGDMAASGDPRPALLAVPEHDQFDPPSRARSLTSAWPSTDLRVVPGADHFLSGRLDLVFDLALVAIDAVAPRDDAA